LYVNVKFAQVIVVYRLAVELMRVKRFR